MFISDELELQKITVTVGDCLMLKYREIEYDEEHEVVSVREHKHIPDWYLRNLKLKALGL